MIQVFQVQFSTVFGIVYGKICSNISAFMFNILRSDGGTDGGAAGPAGKAHPIFGRRTGKSISSGGDGGVGQSWKALPCTVSN